MRRPATPLAALLILSALALSACGSGGADSDTVTGPVPGSPEVVVTTSIWADVVANVACEGAATITTLIPIGGDPHTFEPSLRDRERVSDADLVVVNGLFLEESLEDTIDAAEVDGTAVFAMADHLDTLEAEGEHADDAEGDEADDEHAGEAEGDEHGSTDPHVWFDPTRVAAALPALGDALVGAGVERAAVDTCVTAYQAELAALDAEIEATLARVPPPRRVLVTNHEALSYFADRYGFEILGAVIPSPSTLSQASAADLEALAKAITAAEVPAIFAETQHSSDDAEALAGEVGEVEVVTLFTDSLGEAGSGAETYTDLLRTDARLIADALSG